MNTLIVCGGEIRSADLTYFAPLAREADFVIGVDRGCDILAGAGMRPDLAVGDFDSSKEGPEACRGTDVRRYACEKDFSDTEAALGEAVSAGSSRIVILGGCGGRLDHFLANLMDLTIPLEAGIPAVLCDRQNYLFLMDHPFSVKESESGWRISGSEGAASFSLPKLESGEKRYFSLLPVFGGIEGLSVTGCRYGGEGLSLDRRSASLGISNELLGGDAAVSWKEGVLAVVLSKDMG